MLTWFNQLLYTQSTSQDIIQVPMVLIRLTNYRFEDKNGWFLKYGLSNALNILNFKTKVKITEYSIYCFQ